MGQTAFDVVVLVLLALIIVRQEIHHMSTTQQLTDLETAADTVVADEVQEKADLTTIIADLEDLEGNVNSTVTLADVITKLKGLNTNMQSDDAAVQAGIATDAPATPPVVTPPVTPAS